MKLRGFDTDRGEERIKNFKNLAEGIFTCPLTCASFYKSIESHLKPYLKSSHCFLLNRAPAASNGPGRAHDAAAVVHGMMVLLVVRR